MKLPRIDPTVLFSYAFRPFFLLVGAYAVLMVLGWGLYLGGILAWPETPPASVRHGHEMLFGFAGGAIAGFLLTAVATWTARPPVSGAWLVALCGAWLAARLAAFLPGDVGLRLWGGASLLFWGGLVGLLAREVIAARNARNYKVVPLLAAFLLTEAYFFKWMPDDDPAMQTALRTGLFLVLGMISLVGGRIIPSFTQNWLRANRPDVPWQLPPFDRLDWAALKASVLFAVGFVLWPAHWIAGLAGLAAALLQAWRLARWKGWQARREPLLWVLHVGYGWIPVGFGLMGWGVMFQNVGLVDSGLHALTYGAIGTLILGVAARVALGHTGRPLQAFPSMAVAFCLITLGAAIRVIAPLGGPLVGLSVILWTVAYGLFLWRYAPILLGPRQTQASTASSPK